MAVKCRGSKFKAVGVELGARENQSPSPSGPNDYLKPIWVVVKIRVPLWAP